MAPQPDAGPLTSQQGLLSVKAISKSFPGVKALSHVDLTVRRGEVHALMGENGAGKSTLIKVLTGVYTRDAGEILLDGRAIHPRSPREAEACGISTVYQEVNLIPFLSVAENIALGRQPKRFGLLDWKKIRARAKAALNRVGIDLDVTQPLASFSIAIQQLVAIARALDVSAKLLILDEPTSSLDEQEVAQLFQVLKKLKREGLAIIFVTHFLDQVYAISDRITVLRNGQRVGEFEAAALPRLELIARMMGKDVAELEKISHRPARPAALAQRAAFLQARGLGRKASIAPFDFSIARGEIVGLAGLLGSGRTEMARLLFGIDKPDSGEMRIEGKPRPAASPRCSIELGFGFCSEDRKTEGIIPNLSVRENIILALQANQGWMRYVSRQKQEELAGQFIRSLNIATSDAEKPIKFLSGGNQQKVLLARWLASQPRFLILDEPTRGIDVGAKFEIEKLMNGLAEQGMAILFISSELEEIVRSSHRVVVLRDRSKIGELNGDEISEARIMHTIAAPAPAHSGGEAGKSSESQPKMTVEKGSA
ncbi:MAG: sugar ABC transporter ATP-binding protein [Verrucomicrobiota bacterium]